ncbi:kinase-like domain-containing protein [Blastocladiella britannica]|nr:kinase-like domain-containing protein [Blastocladiella britannica]
MPSLLAQLKEALTPEDRPRTREGVVDTLTSVWDLYEKKEKIGEGHFAEVYRVVHKETGKEYALKSIKKKKIPKGKEKVVKREIDILARVAGHKNIVGLVPEDGFFETDRSFHLVMELCNGGELFDVIVSRGYLAESEAALIVYQILEAVGFLHEINIVHRDLKPDNLLIKDRDAPKLQIMLSDFGLSRLMDYDDQIFLTACGTPGYIAPEVITNLGHSFPADMWSIGVICYTLISGNMPFYAETNAGIFERILTGAYEFDPECWSEVSEDAIDFIRKLLAVDPDERMSCAEARQHQWLTYYFPLDGTVGKDDDDVREGGAQERASAAE